MEDKNKTKSQHKKSKISTFTGIYLVFVLLLAVLIPNLWSYVWRECENYQKNSASTILDAVCSELSEKTGEELSYKLISKTADEEDEFIYTMKSGNEKVAEVYLKKTQSGFMGLAYYKLIKTVGLRSYVINYPQNCIVYVNGEKLEGEPKDFSFGDQRTLNYTYAVKYKTITASGVCSSKDIDVKDSEGNSLVLQPQSDKSLLACNYYDGEELLAMQNAAFNLSYHFTKYMSQEYDFWTLYDELFPESGFIWDVYYSRIDYYGPHDSSSICNEKISKPLYLGPGVVIVNTSYNWYIYSSGIENEFNIEHQMVLRKYPDGTWKVADLLSSIINELELVVWEK